MLDTQLDLLVISYPNRLEYTHTQITLKFMLLTHLSLSLSGIDTRNIYDLCVYCTYISYIYLLLLNKKIKIPLNHQPDACSEMMIYPYPILRNEPESSS